MERKYSGNRTTGLCIKQRPVLRVTRIFKFQYNPPGSVEVMGKVYYRLLVALICLVFDEIIGLLT